MGDLRDLVTSLGFDAVETYVQSGNVVFTGTGSPSAAARAIEARLTADLGLDVPVIVRSKRQMAQIIEANPYAGLGADPKTVHVTFLAEPPDAERRRDLARAAAEAGPDGAFGDDRFELADGHIFLYCPGGYGVTKLNNAFFERRGGVVATTRNWRTITTLAGMAGVEVAGA
jgi:uncharacterized protein (DUF1697 family)